MIDKNLSIILWSMSGTYISFFVATLFLCIYEAREDIREQGMCIKDLFFLFILCLLGFIAIWIIIDDIKFWNKIKSYLRNKMNKIDKLLEYKIIKPKKKDLV